MRKLTALLALVLLALAPAAAQAGEVRASAGDPVIDDCTDDGRIQGSYSTDEFRAALKDLPSDVDQYTDCREKIRRAMLARSGGGGGKGGPSSDPASPDPPSAEEQRAIETVTERTPEPVKLNGGLENGEDRPGPIVPGVSASNSLPLPVLLALIGGLLALVGGRARSRSGGPS